VRVVARRRKLKERKHLQPVVALSRGQ
jgi:hypothetical protein